MSQILLIAAMLVGGVAVAVQPSINARLAEKPVSACINNLLRGRDLVLLILSLIASQGSFRRIGEADWWQLTGGFMGAFFVTMTVVAVPVWERRRCWP